MKFNNLNFYLQDGLIETSRRTKPRFVHCFLPYHRAGLVDQTTPNGVSAAVDEPLHVPTLRSQLRGSQLLPAMRLHRRGYPDHMPFVEFIRRFGVLAQPAQAELMQISNTSAGQKQAVETLLLHIDLEKTCYRLGLSQVSNKNTHTHFSLSVRSV